MVLEVLLGSISGRYFIDASGNDLQDTGLPLPVLAGAAHHLIGQVTTEGRLLSEAIGAGALDHLAPEDRARAQRLATQSLRDIRAPRP